MTIAEAITQLQRIEAAHGPTTEVYFDCPQCGLSFTPNVLAKVAVHLPAALTQVAVPVQPPATPARKR